MPSVLGMYNYCLGKYFTVLHLDPQGIMYLMPGDDPNIALANGLSQD